MNAKVLTYTVIAILAAAVIGLSIYLAVIMSEKEEYKRRSEIPREYAFQALVSDMNLLETKLYKLQATADPTQSVILLMDIWRQTGNVEAEISTISMSLEESSELLSFVNTLGDYTRELSYTVANGGELSKSDVDQISNVTATCKGINDNIYKIWEDGIQLTTTKQDEKLEGNIDIASERLPRLIYDGPFSESTINKKPKYLGKEVVDEGRARQIAEEFMSVEKNVVKAVSPTNGNLASFNFEGEKGGNPFYISVSKQGGKVLSFNIKTPSSITALPTDNRAEELKQKAIDYAAKKGFGECQGSYIQYYDGNAVVNVVPVQNDVKIYPDIIKIWVNIESGEVSGMDAKNYYISHCDRTLENSKITAEAAREKLNAGLKVKNVSEAIIPLTSGKEVHCYEFVCTVGEKDCIVYIDVKEGKEQDILIIKHTNEGTLTE